jgi:hypothetical protein
VAVSGPAADAYAATTAALVAVLRALNTQIKALADSIDAQLATHPDQAIFTSLPRSGRVRAARLLTEIGDARGRFPTPDSLACLAGVAPSTRQSGKVKAVVFRWGADKQLRDALCDFAADSRHANPWATRLYNDAIARGHDHPTPSASWPAPGSGSSGAAGTTTPPTTRPPTEPSKPSSTKINRRLPDDGVDTGQLTRSPR